MSIEGLVLQYCSPHNIHNTKKNIIMHNQETLKINYTKDIDHIQQKKNQKISNLTILNIDKVITYGRIDPYPLKLIKKGGQ